MEKADKGAKLKYQIVLSLEFTDPLSAEEKAVVENSIARVTSHSALWGCTIGVGEISDAGDDVRPGRGDGDLRDGGGDRVGDLGRTGKGQGG